MGDYLGRAVSESFERFVDGVLRFLPDFLTAIVILLMGIVLGGLMRMIAQSIFRLVRLDRFAERLGFVALFRKGGIQEPVSSMLAKTMGWTILAFVSIIALYALNVPAVEQLIEGFLLYLPNVFVAAVILAFGYVLSNFLGRAALIAAVNAGFKLSGLIGRFVKFTVFFLVIAMAMEQLGIGGGTVITAFAILFGGIILAFALAFGLAGRDLARDYLEKKIRGQQEKDIDIDHL
jgi:hypothetical protein